MPADVGRLQRRLAASDTLRRVGIDCCSLPAQGEKTRRGAVCLQLPSFCFEQIQFARSLTATSFGRTPSTLYRLWIHAFVGSVFAGGWFFHRFCLNGTPHQSPQLLNFLIQFWCGLSVTSCSCLDLYKVLILLSQRKLLFSLSHNDSFPLRSHSYRKVCTLPCCSYIVP